MARKIVSFHLGHQVVLCHRMSDPKVLAAMPRVQGKALGEFTAPVFDWFKGVPDAMDLNDSLGDCVVAGMAKMVRSWTQNATGTAAAVTNADILDVYEKGAGYNPADPSTDQGWYLPDALAYWKTTGIAGHKILASGTVVPTNHNLVRAASYLYGGLYIAFNLPLTAQDQTVWDVVSTTGDGAPGSWGGHCVTLQCFPGDDNPTIRTWGKAQVCTWAFIDAYCPEMHAVVSPDYVRADGTTPAGVTLATLQADLALV